MSLKKKIILTLMTIRGQNHGAALSQSVAVQSSLVAALQVGSDSVTPKCGTKDSQPHRNLSLTWKIIISRALVRYKRKIIIDTVYLNLFPCSDY